MYHMLFSAAGINQCSQLNWNTKTELFGQFVMVTVLKMTQLGAYLRAYNVEQENSKALAP